MKLIYFFYGILICFHGLKKNDTNQIHVTYKLLNSSLTTTQSSNQKVIETLKGVDKGINEVEFDLFCNTKESVYKLKKKLQIDENNIGYKMAVVIGGKGMYYKNTQEKVKIKQKISQGETFIIKYPYEMYNWTITKETKMIDGYKCYKATSTIKEYDPIRKRENVFSPEVWFTPEIPYPFGPKGLDGLPGLVLEATFNGKTIFYADKIDFKCVECNKMIKQPTKGKEISLEGYLKLQAEIMEERN